MPTTPNEPLARDIIPAQEEHLPGPMSSGRRKRWRFWTGMCFAVVLLAVFAWPLLSLIDYAATSDLHSYTLLIPFVSAYLLYLRRHQLPKDYASDVRLGILFLVAGLAILAFTYWLDFTGRALFVNSRIVLLTFSFLCCLAAGGSFFLGRPWMRAAAFPLGFLIFMVPMPDAMADALETASKYASAEVANLLFQLSGTPFLRAGLVFQLPNITIEVAQACSGIRSSLALLILAILVAHFYLDTFWKQLVLVVAGLFVMILKNGVRIVTLTLLASYVDPGFLYGRLHHEGGVVFFVLALLMLAPLVWLLERSERKVTAPASS